ncbi:MAG: SEC-C metal-binding domain-containing protein [Woeseiaceae bacterium]
MQPAKKPIRCFLQSRHIRRPGTPEAHEIALKLNQEALAIDAGYPPAWEGVAEMYVLKASYGLRPVDEGFRLARLRCRRGGTRMDRGPLRSRYRGRVCVNSANAIEFPILRQAPWKSAADTQLLRLDIPELGVEGACVSIIGALGQSAGFIIFPSLMAFESFLDATEEVGPASEMPDLGTTTLALNFERGADLPARMRREAAEHGWVVAGRNAYPQVQHRNRDGLPRPLGEHDVRVVAACASALAAFCIKHPGLFGEEQFESICESWLNEGDLEVRFTVPYEAGSLFPINHPEVLPVERPTAKVGRNVPCPCGSGRKYKKCCLPREQARRTPSAIPSRLHDVDRRLIERMLRFGARRFGKAWSDAAEAHLDLETQPGLFVPWSVYHVRIDGKPLAQWFTDEQGRSLSGTESRWLEAQQAAWLSVWEINAVEAGRSLTLEDLLTGEKRIVSEVALSAMLTRRDTILACVVDCDDGSLIGGCHMRSLPPQEAAGVVERIRRRLRRKQAIPPERLRDEKTGAWMIACWDEAVADLDEHLSIPPRLANTDGEELLLTVDRFEFDPARREEIEQLVAALPDVEPPAPGATDRSYVFLRKSAATEPGWNSTIIGRAAVSKGRLRLETNSVKRADALRGQLESACGSLLRHRGRDHSDPLSERVRADHGAAVAAGVAEEELPPAVALAMLRQFKAQHYADWANQPLPALGGKTPRDTAKSKAGKAAVHALLKDMEHHEGRLPAEQQFNFSPLRRELDLNDGDRVGRRNP